MEIISEQTCMLAKGYDECAITITRDTDETLPRNVVLVTGGSGFLGQHVVKLLQTNADHVTEIRVLDVVPYTNRLGHIERLNVTSYTGSITDYNHVMEACKGVDCVMHIASYVDVRLFPDEKLSHSVNVRGTETVISACKASGVKRLIYCSTMDVVMSRTDILDGNEDNTAFAEQDNMFPVYGPSKVAAERLVINANDETLHTLSLRPAGMYGELGYIMKAAASPVQTFGVFFRINTTPLYLAYVGNVAWAFLCADRTLSNKDERAKQASGKAYFVGDQTPNNSLFETAGPILQDAGATACPLTIPLWLIIGFMYIVYAVLFPFRLCCGVNVRMGLDAFLLFTKTFLFSHAKASKELDYSPIFSVSESRTRTVVYIKEVLEGKHG